jgi:hypothetical protein
MHLAFELDAARIDLPAGLGLNLPLVLRADIDTLHNHTIFFRQNVDHFTAFTLIFKASADNFNSIAFANLNSHSFTLLR